MIWKFLFVQVSDLAAHEDFESANWFTVAQYNAIWID